MNAGGHMLVTALSELKCDVFGLTEYLNHRIRDNGKISITENAFEMKISHGKKYEEAILEAQLNISYTNEADNFSLTNNYVIKFIKNRMTKWILNKVCLIKM